MSVELRAGAWPAVLMPVRIDPPGSSARREARLPVHAGVAAAREALCRRRRRQRWDDPARRAGRRGERSRPGTSHDLGVSRDAADDEVVVVHGSGPLVCLSNAVGVVHGIRCTTPDRAIYDEVRNHQLRGAVVHADMACAAGVVDRDSWAAHIGSRPWHPPLRNPLVTDEHGTVIGMPDLLDPELGVVAVGRLAAARARAGQLRRRWGYVVR